MTTKQISDAIDSALDDFEDGIATKEETSLVLFSIFTKQKPSSQAPSFEEFKQWATSIGKTNSFAKKLYQYLSSSNFTNANGTPIKNWKRYCSSMLTDDKWSWGDADNQDSEDLQKIILTLVQQRGRAVLLEENAKSILSSSNNHYIKETIQRYLQLRQKHSLDDNSIQRFLRDRKSPIL